jgi:hypothetical protein
MTHFYGLCSQFWGFAAEQPADALAFVWGYGAWNSPQQDADMAVQLGHALPAALLGHSPQNLDFWRVCLGALALGGGNIWGAGLWLTLLSFIGHWYLYTQAARFVPPRWQLGVAIPLLWLPNTLLWTSGLLKEAWLGGLVAAAAGAVLASLTLPPRRAARLWALAAVLLYLAYQVKPYCAMAVGPCLALLVGWVRLRRCTGWPRWALLLGLGLGCVAFVWVAETQDRGIGYVTGFARVVREYTLEYSPPEDETRQVANLPPIDPGPWGVVAVLPAGWVNATLRPWPWESRSVFRWFLALENLLSVVGLLGLGVGVWRRVWAGQWHLSAPGVAFLLYSVLYLAFIGVSTPYFGTIVRYRAVAIPYLLLGAVLLGAGYADWALRSKPTPTEH